MTGIHQMMFGGEKALGALITAKTVSSASSSANTASYKLTFSGTVTNHNNTVLETWLITGTAADFDARATITAGTFSAGTFGSWLNLATTQIWSNTAAASPSTVTGTMTVDIRRTDTGAILTSASVTVDAERL